MKVLITGGAGFIGTNLAKYLIKKKHSVTSIDDYSTGSPDNHVDGVIYKTENIINITSPHIGKKFDIIFHLAALARIQPSFENPSETFEANVIGTQKVLEFADMIGAKVIYAGSSSKWHDPYQSPYAAFKFMGETLCKMYKKTFSTDVQIARFYNVYGPNEIIDGDYSAVIGKWRNLIANNKPITIYGNGEQRRDFTHVDDIVDALYKIATTDYVHEDAWELGTGINYSINELALIFKDKFNCGVEYLPPVPGDYAKTLRENDSALEILNWEPKDKLMKYIFSL